MDKNSNDIESTFSPQRQINQHWLKIFNELCYEVFYKNKQGAMLLAHLENKFFRSPVAFPHREPSWAYFNEGQNEMIRSFTAGIQAHLALSQAQTKAQKELSEALPQKGRPRKSTLRPVK